MPPADSRARAVREEPVVGATGNRAPDHELVGSGNLATVVVELGPERQRIEKREAERPTGAERIRPWGVVRFSNDLEDRERRRVAVPSTGPWRPTWCSSGSRRRSRSPASAGFPRPPRESRPRTDRAGSWSSSWGSGRTHGHPPAHLRAETRACRGTTAPSGSLSWSRAPGLALAVMVRYSSAGHQASPRGVSDVESSHEPDPARPAIHPGARRNRATAESVGRTRLDAEPHEAIGRERNPREPGPVGPHAHRVAVDR